MNFKSLNESILSVTNRSVVKEGQAYSGDPPYSGVERRAKSGPNQRATKGSSRTEYNHFEGEYRPSGEQDRYYARKRAEEKAKKTTTVKEGLIGKLKKKVSRFGQAFDREMSDGDKSLKQELASKREAPKGSPPSWVYGGVRRDARDARKNETKGLKPGQTRREDGRLRNSKGVLESKSGLVEEQKYIEEYIELLESALESIAEELECSVEDLLEDLPPKEYVDKIKKKTQDARAAQLSPVQRAAAMKDRNSSIHRTPAELKAHDAGMKAYVKSQNNRTDSKGKKLDPYDDYQS